MELKFFILKTLAGSYFIGVHDVKYNTVRCNEHRIKIDDILIPMTAIEYYKHHISYDEFIQDCLDAGILDREDVKKALIYYSRNLNGE